MSLIGNGNKVPRKLATQIRHDRLITADIPIPDKNDRLNSVWGFMQELRSGESFLAYGDKERSACTAYARTKDFKVVTRKQEEFQPSGTIAGACGIIYRVWKV